MKQVMIILSDPRHVSLGSTDSGSDPMYLVNKYKYARQNVIRHPFNAVSIVSFHDFLLYTYTPLAFTFSFLFNCSSTFLSIGFYCLSRKFFFFLVLLGGNN